MPTTERLTWNLPRITIVTPSFNQAAFLEATILSVLDQGYPNLEYMIMDGGSTDGSVDIIKRYADRLAYWVSEKDRGQSDAINKGWQRATGDIIAYINSDDTYLPGSFAAAARLFQENPKAGLVYGNGYVIDEHGNIVRERIPGPVTLANLLAWSPTIPQPCMFMSRQALDTVGLLRTDLHYTMDYELTIRIGRKFPIVYGNVFLATMRGHGAAKTAVAPEKHVEEGLRVTEEFFDGTHDPNIQKLKAVSLASLHLRKARVFTWSNRKQEARASIADACRISRHPIIIGKAIMAWTLTTAGSCMPALRRLKARLLATIARAKS